MTKKRKIEVLSRFEKGDKVVVNEGVIYDANKRRLTSEYTAIIKSKTKRLNYYRLSNPRDMFNNSILNKAYTDFDICGSLMRHVEKTGETTEEEDDDKTENDTEEEEEVDGEEVDGEEVDGEEVEDEIDLRFV